MFASKRKICKTPPSMSELKTTPLFEHHKKLGAKIIPFAGWKMPLEFSNARKEHLAVRKAVGIFDVSHMGEIQIKDPKALEFLSSIVTNNVQDLRENHCQYTLMCNEQGGILDDMILYCLKKPSDYLLCVNAGNVGKILKWMKSCSKISIEDVSEKWGQIAVQGPDSKTLIQKIFPSISLKRFHFCPIDFQESSHLISRTGYTGEDGFEILSPKEKALKLWEELLSLKAMPAGLSARNTLRLEMKYPLYGSDMDEAVTPCEMGLTWACKNKSDFIGKKACFKSAEKRWVGFEVLEKSGIPRTSYAVFSTDKERIGSVTSGAFSPSLEKMIGLALVKKDFSKQGCRFFVQIHGNMALSQVVPTPFYVLNK